MSAEPVATLSWADYVKARGALNPEQQARLAEIKAFRATLTFTEGERLAWHLNTRALNTPSTSSDSTYPPSPMKKGQATVILDDFYAYMPMHNYLHIPSGGNPWPGSSVDARIEPVEVGTKEVDRGKGKEKHKEVVPVTMSASLWLDKNRPVEQMTWWPGRQQLIEGAVFCGGVLVPNEGTRIFNTYRPPLKNKPGDAEHADRWLKLIGRLYPADRDHIVAWLAHRVQRPDVKVNHAIVLGGAPGIGKDSILDPVRTAIGEWNFNEVSPGMAMGRFNGFLKSVILRINEVHDTGDVSRFDFYNHMLAYLASPPEVLRCDEKHLREYEVPNLVGVVMTTNYRTNGIYLPPNDRRHFVAWSDATREDVDETYWTGYYRWLHRGGRAHVAALLSEYDLSGFDPKAPPKKTEAFWAIADANMAPEDDEMSTAITALGSPAALVIAEILAHNSVDATFKGWLMDRKNSRLIVHRLETAGYIAVRNDGAKTGKWKVAGKDCRVYGRAELTLRDRVLAARRLVEELGQGGGDM